VAGAAPRRIVIVGGGFSGAATAAALLRRREAGPHVTLVERSGVFGRSVAHTTTRGEHLLNVAAGKMSALPHAPGHFVGWARADGRIACELAARRPLHVDAVVNAAGPAWDCRRGEHALLRDLIARGLAAPGPLGLGLGTADDGALLDAAGRPSEVLFTLGALRRGELWESVAVTELSAQACALAERVSAPARALAA
jgi:uncharacterized NAD(P)/FAD-binding protein YdhS